MRELFKNILRFQIIFQIFQYIFEMYFWNAFITQYLETLFFQYILLEILFNFSCKRVNFFFSGNVWSEKARQNKRTEQGAEGSLWKWWLQVKTNQSFNLFFYSFPQTWFPQELLQPSEPPRWEENQRHVPQVSITIIISHFQSPSKTNLVATADHRPPGPCSPYFCWGASRPRDFSLSRLRSSPPRTRWPLDSFSMFV